MRTYKTLPYLWVAASLATLVILGLLIRWDIKGEMVSLAKFTRRYFGEVFFGSAKASPTALLVLGIWPIAAFVIGWVAHGLIIMLFLNKKSSNPNS